MILDYCTTVTSTGGYCKTTGALVVRPQMKKGLGVPPKRLHLGTHRMPPARCSCAGPPPAMPQLLFITKVLPSTCYHCGFGGHFWKNSCPSLV